MKDNAPSEVPAVAFIGADGQAAATGALSADPSIRRERFWNRNFTLLWQGQLVSSMGKQVFALVCMLTIKQLTGSGSLMGLLMMAALLPSVLLGPAAGVFVDRLDRRKLIAWTDIAGGIFVLAALAAMLALPNNTPAIIAAFFAVTICTGLLDTFSQPAISASLPDLVPAGSLEAANGLNMGSVQMAIFAAQGGAGLLFKLLGAPLLVLANAATYLYSGVSELFIRIPRREGGRHSGEKPWRRFRLELSEGLRFVARYPGMLAMIVSFTVLNFLVSPILVTLPFFAQNYLGQGPEWYGFFMAAFGIGALSGYLLVAARPSRGRRRAAWMVAGMLGQSILILAALLCRSPYAALPIMFIVGLANGVLNVNINTLMQIVTPRELLGRVNALTQTLAAGAMPLGMALSGILFDLSGQNVPLMFTASGVTMIIASLLPLVVSRDYWGFLSTESGVAQAAPITP
jgi:MFS family permease